MRAPTPVLGRVMHVLGSVQLAMAMLVGGVAAMAVGMIIESRAGLESARSAIYQTVWFDIYLAILGVNLIAAVIKRLPIKRVQWGFVLTHFAIVLLLGGTWISRSFGFEGQVVVAEGETSRNLQMNGALIGLRREHAPWQRFELPDGAFLVGELPRDQAGGKPRLEVLEHVPFGIPTWELRPGSGGLPGIELQLEAPTGTKHEWLLSDSPGLSRRELGPVVIELVHFAGDEGLQLRLAPQLHVPEAGLKVAEEANKPLLSILMGARSEMYMQVTTRAGRAQGLPLALNEGYDVRDLGLRLTVTRKYESAGPWTRVEEVSATSEQTTPCLLIGVELGDERSEFWLARGGSQQFSMGASTYTVDYAHSSRELPFSIQLNGFRMRTDPEGRRPVSLASHITLRQLGKKHTGISTVVAMDQPVDFLGFRIFQSSYEKGSDGQPDISVLSVTHDPGIPIVYTAFILLILGVSWHLLGDRRRRSDYVLVPKSPSLKAEIRTGQEAGTGGDMRPHRPHEAPSRSGKETPR